MNKDELWEFWQQFRNMRVLIHRDYCGGVTGKGTEDCPACAHLAKLDQDFQRHLNTPDPA